MPPILTEKPSLPQLAQDCLSFAEPGTTGFPTRPLSIWEITSWVLPMAPEHLRRVLAADPGLPQGSAGSDGGTRWFTATEVAALRRHFAQGRLKARYQPQRPAASRAPLIAMTGPRGAIGRTTALLHLATAAALSGYRVLVIDADPAGHLAESLGAGSGPDSGSNMALLALIARSCGQHLHRTNASRVDRGEPPQAMAESLSQALETDIPDLIHPSRWPGLDILPTSQTLMQADLHIASWRGSLQVWQPWTALAAGLDEAGLRSRYDLILADTGRGLGPLALAVLASADVLLAPVSLTGGGLAGVGLAGVGAGLDALATAMAALAAEDRMTARALGRAATAFGGRRLAVLPVRAGVGSATQLAGFAAKLGPALLPAPLPEVPQIAAGAVAQFYDLDYRDIGRLTYAPLRQACEDAWRGVAGIIAGLWAEDASRI